MTSCADRSKLHLLTTFLRILGDTTFLSDMLQTSSMNLSRAIDLIEALQERFVHHRDEAVFVDLWKEVVAANRQPKTSSALIGAVVTVGHGKHLFV